jgi:hypothetical protein
MAKNKQTPDILNNQNKGDKMNTKIKNPKCIKLAKRKTTSDNNTMENIETKNEEMANNQQSNDIVNIEINQPQSKELQMSNENSTSVDEILNNLDNSTIQEIAQEPVITTTTELPAPKVIKTEEPAKVKVVKAATIIIADLKLPEGGEVISRKSYTRINGNGRSIIVKGSALEFDTVVENLDLRQVVLTDEQRKKQHAGKSKMTLKGVKDTADLQIIMDRYYSAQ